MLLTNSGECPLIMFDKQIQKKVSSIKALFPKTKIQSIFNNQQKHFELFSGRSLGDLSFYSYLMSLISWPSRVSCFKNCLALFRVDEP